MKDFTFTNLDTNKEINVPITKEITYIYGGNGSGKTTFSRDFSNKINNSKVFNTDFISRNVYIVDSDGARSDASNKENFSNLFVSEEAVRLAQLMIEVKDIGKEVGEIKKQKIKEFENRIGAYKINSNVDFSDVSKAIDFSEALFDYTKSIAENRNLFKYKEKLDTTIQNEDNLIINVNQYTSNQELIRINEFIKDDSILNSIFFEGTLINTLNELIEKNNSMLKKINMAESVFKDKGDIEKVKEWISRGVLLHSDITKCIFCGTDDVSLAINQWANILKDESLEYKKELLEYIERVSNTLENKIISKADYYEGLIPLIVETSKQFGCILKILKQRISNNEPYNKIDINIRVDKTAKKVDEIYLDIINYIVNEMFEDLMFPVVYSEYLEKKKNDFEVRANEESAKYAEQTEEVIQKVANELGFGKEIEIVSETRKGSIPKLSLTPVRKGKIRIYSEGQRHKLALAIFFADIISKEEKYDFVVLDDPMISLDIVSYQKLKTYLISKETSSKYTNIIVLTHNINYLLFMLSNVFQNQTISLKTDLLELNSSSCTNVPIEILAKDDIVLFRESIRNTTTIDDVSLWYWMIDKMARYVMDLKLSFKGKVSFNDVKADIEDAFSTNLIDKARILNSKFTKVSKSTSSTISDIVDALNCLNKFVQLLEFPMLVDESDITRITEGFDSTEKVKKNPEAKNLTFEILKEGYKAVFDISKNNSHLKNYIMHPRHQITSSLIAYQAQRDV